MGKVKENSGLVTMMKKRLRELQSTIEDMDEKRGNLFIKWLQVQNNYLNWEVGFNPKKRKTYTRGEVVHIHFGFNTGSEHGGPHWGVILDENALTNPVAVVMPLGSLDEGETEKDVHPEDVFLGQIPEINSNLVYAIPNQIRTISKLRITKPKQWEDKSQKLTPDQLDKIDAKLFEVLFSKSRKLKQSIVEEFEKSIIAQHAAIAFELQSEELDTNLSTEEQLESIKTLVEAAALKNDPVYNSTVISLLYENLVKPKSYNMSTNI